PLLDGVAGEDRNKNGVDDAEDYGIFDLKVVGPGKINLPMTTFGWFAAGSEISDPRLQDYQGTLEWYNMLQGYVPTDDIANPTPWYEGNNPALPVTVYPLAGDPVTQTGDVDGTYELNLAPADRRMCLTSGPFDFPDGEVQEVVVAVVGGLGDTRFSSITAMKNTDIVAQTLYDGAFEGVPKAPKGPKVTTIAFEDNVVLEWGSDADAAAATEGVVIAGYAFEGYNVYQLPNPAASKDEAELIATYDLVNGIEVIKGKKFVAEYGQVVEVPVQFGADVGVKRSFHIEKDYLTGDPLYEGNTYYFAVTAYNYNPAPVLIEDKSLESALIAAPIVIQEPLPGDTLAATYGDVEELTHSAGTCDGGATVKVIDPYALTGHDYEVFFDQQHYYRDVDGVWKETAYPDAVGKKLGKVTDVSPSSITGSALASSTVGTYDLIFTLDLQAPGGAWVDGVRLDIPSDLTVNTWSMSGSYGSYGTAQGQNCVNMDGTIDASNSITWGDSARSTFGCIEGTIILTVNVQPFEFPKTVGYAVYDDAYDGTTIDAEGTITLTELGYEFKSISHWNLKDVTSDEILLEDQTIVSGKDVDTGEETGDDVIEYIDGFQVSIQASYSAPTDFTTYTHTGPNRTTPDVFSHSRANAWLNYDQWGKPFEITSYADHGWSGGAGTAASIDALGFGTTSVDLLQCDYELRFTGEYDAAVGNYHPIKDGTGSLAILYGARGYDIADHPDANNPGDGSAFFIQVPFEVWDMEAPDGPQQISMLIYDRMGDATATDFYAFNPADRVYCEFLMVPYEDVIAGSAGDYLESGNLTWNTVWWNCDWTLGDKLLFQYDNPIQLGVDKFAFSTTAPVLSNADSAKVAVEKINVFPNPYYAYNSLSTNRFDNYVTFTHLPGKATIRIFTLAGIQVKVFEKDSPSIQFLRWDLQNESGLPVASGVYIAYVDMPNLNKTKVLKFVIIQNKQILEYY
ncbi:MAG: T9SS type A sorting domain-containing protein, partial [Candidatus Marinimicrobia bacterium]|nr:T9SS type A sorting domain-containing protein [Candidatus Neomarinimicrobiota bacterium]